MSKIEQILENNQQLKPTRVGPCITFIEYKLMLTFQVTQGRYFVRLMRAESLR